MYLRLRHRKPSRGEFPSTLDPLAVRLSGLISCGGERSLRTQHITARLSDSVKARFDSYAAKCGISASALACLLIRREMYRNRLRRKISVTVPPAQSRSPTLSAHVSAVMASEFQEYCDSIGRVYGPALAALIELELKERWLDRSLRARNR